MRAQRLPHGPLARGGQRTEAVASLAHGQRAKLRREDPLDLFREASARFSKPGGDHRRKRLVEHDGATDGRKGLEHRTARSHEPLDPSGQRQGVVDGLQHPHDALRLDVRSDGVKRLHVAEVVEDRAQRHAGTFGDQRRGRPQHALVDQREHRLRDGPAGALRTSGTAVGARGPDGGARARHGRDHTPYCTASAISRLSAHRRHRRPALLRFPREGSVDDWREKEARYFLRAGRRMDLLAVRGEGTRLWDAQGCEYLDFFGGPATISLGHSHPVIVDALTDQARQLIHVSNQFYSLPQLQLAELLVEHSCFDRVYFMNSGAEANEGALKLARKWGKEHKDGAYEFICAEN